MKSKIASKGIRHNTGLMHEHFLRALYDQTDIPICQTSMVYDQEFDLMTVKQQFKNSINRIYTKRTVLPDNVRTISLRQNGHFL